MWSTPKILAVILVSALVVIFLYLSYRQVDETIVETTEEDEPCGACNTIEPVSEETKKIPKSIMKKGNSRSDTSKSVRFDI